ncbi:hypothetical protein HBH98_125370 [Parastagonospora nodorum]|nr:hypothetical protein HBH53_119410 [Parastagonospora nodorum]KAH3970537.1 hypothetical protein HBH51_115830 [Parastagonospora nodorum]KAH3971832.1 hypothetical protein HBH52_158100 [Parastagonospora nodorum]KAH3996545.1 hypothetical protein HBI10_157200 [Parastagonospora nodorum]KAH4018983.1 hypothetical protein HBI13_128870 [Parastagonospora nodorum]
MPREGLHITMTGDFVNGTCQTMCRKLYESNRNLITLISQQYHQSYISSYPFLRSASCSMCLTLHYEYSCHPLASETVLLPCHSDLDKSDLATLTDDRNPIAVCPRSWVKKITPPNCVSCLIASVQGSGLTA